MTKNISKHHFSFYYSTLQISAKQHKLVITDPVLLHRLTTIVRYHVGDTCILFNESMHVDIEILGISKKIIECKILESKKNSLLQPEIVLFLPLLKKEALETAIYNAVVAGVSKIQLIIVEKCHKKIITETDYNRLEKILIAACEQSKYYSIPNLARPLELAQAVILYKDYQFYFADPEGSALQRLINKAVIMVGPEGDLLPDEKEILRKQGAYFFSLTPTILRSQEAVLVAISYARMI